MTEPADPPTAVLDEGLRPYTLTDILNITDAAERNGIERALGLVHAAAGAHRGHTCRPADCIREVAQSVAKDLGVPT